MTATSRTLVAALAAATLAAPNALAKPIDPPLKPIAPQPHHTAPAPGAQDDGGIDVGTIGIGAAGSILAVGAIAGVATRSRHPRRRGAAV